VTRPTEITGAPERRAVAVSDFEIRATGDTLALRGYASVFDHPYDIFGGPSKGGWSEIVDKRAFDVTLREKPDLHLLINHEGMPLARTKSGTLKLATDNHGLIVDAPDLDRRDPDVQRLEVKMDRGDMDEMSFAFRVLGQEWSDEDTVRRLTEVSLHKGDVSVVNFGANDATSVGLRSLLAQFGDLTSDDLLVEARALGDLTLLREARDLLSNVIRDATPEEKRTLTLADALALQEA
jgi:HK97 family phage prohead protease